MTANPHSAEPAESTTTVSMVIRAPRQLVYQACTDPQAITQWRVPNGMDARMHQFDFREGGTYRMSLSYRDAQHPAAGKSTEHTDTFRGRFHQLQPGHQIVETIEFESADPAFAGEMTITTTLADVPEGTRVTILCRHIPPGINPRDNETGTKQSLQKLALLCETPYEG
jgi:uncharacterized protein YndB with AHSA1/START domain